MKLYAFNREKHEHKIETEEIRLRNRIDALVMGDEEYLGAAAVHDFNSKSRADQERILTYLQRLADRIAEVRGKAEDNVRIGKYGTLVAFVDGVTYGALMKIVTNYCARIPANMVHFVA